MYCAASGREALYNLLWSTWADLAAVKGEHPFVRLPCTFVTYLLGRARVGRLVRGSAGSGVSVSNTGVRHEATQ